MKKPLYILPGTFDPVTYGHLDVLNRSLDVFGNVQMAIGLNPDKKDFRFSLQERRKLILDCLSSKSGFMGVNHFSGLLMDYARQVNAKAVIRSIRNGSDYEGDKLLFQAGVSQGNFMELLFLPAQSHLEQISSSYVKKMLSGGADISKYVPLNVKHALEARQMGQYFLGVTGEMGSGKSFFCEQLKIRLENDGINVFVIDFDKLGHKILGPSRIPSQILIRKQIADRFGKDLLLSDGSIDRKKLGKIVFSDKQKLNTLTEILNPEIMSEFRKTIERKKGVIIIESALLAENCLLDLCNNNVVFMHIDKPVQKKRLLNDEDRNINEIDIDLRLSNQLSQKQKVELINQNIADKNYGKIVDLNNNFDGNGLTDNKYLNILTMLDVHGLLRFDLILKSLGISKNIKDHYINLKVKYDEENRYYHNWSHVIRMLGILDEISGSLKKREYIALGLMIFFHDFIYELNDKSLYLLNEKESAMAAKQFLSDSIDGKKLEHNLNRLGFEGTAVDFISIIYEGILATDTKYSSNHKLSELLIDIDFSILGEAVQSYNIYAKEIYEEFSFVSDYEYCKGRICFLQKLLDKEKIFLTNYFYAKYEKSARKNITRELNHLTLKLNKFKQR